MSDGRPLSKFDFTVDSWHWVYLIQIEYTNRPPDRSGKKASSKKVFWCGPRSRSQSGVDTTFDPTDEALSLTQGAGWSPERVFWEPRLEGAKFDRTLGSLTTNIQPASKLSFNVTVNGKKEVDLLRDLLLGRWANHRIKAWLFDMDMRTAILKFDGHLDRNPTNLSIGGFSFAATQGLPLEGKWPMTHFKTYNAEAAWTERDRCYVTTFSPAPLGGLAHSYHPGEYVSGSGDPGYHLPDWAKGVFVGRVYGGNVAAETGIWREVVFYGHQYDASQANSAFLFFHVSPQFNCFVDELYISREDGAVNQKTSAISVFNNYATRFGPTGTNIRLEIGTAYFETFYNVPVGTDPARCFARIYGPNTGKPSAPGAAQPYPEYPAIVPLNSTGHTLVTDAEILEQILTEDLELGPQELVHNAFNRFELETVGVGNPAVKHWRDLRSAIPRTIEDSAPEVRKIIGDLAWATMWDMTSKLDLVDGHIGMAPIRRKPTPGQEVVDWKIMHGDPVVVDPPSWIAVDDPDGVYSNQVTSTSPDYYLEPSAANEQLAVSHRFLVTHDDAVEQEAANWNGIKDRKYSGKYWVPVNGTRAAECYEMHGQSLSQPQRAVQITLGPRHFEMNLADTVRYYLQGCHKTIGQIRRLGENWDALRITVTSLHVLHHEDATTVPNIESGKKKEADAAKDLNIITATYTGTPEAEGIEPYSDSAPLHTIITIERDD